MYILDGLSIFVFALSLMISASKHASDTFDILMNIVL